MLARVPRPVILFAVAFLGLLVAALVVWRLVRRESYETRVDARGDAARVLVLTRAGAEPGSDLGAMLAALSRGPGATAPLDVTRVLLPEDGFASALESQQVIELLTEEWKAVVVDPSARDVFEDAPALAAGLGKVARSAKVAPRVVVLMMPFVPRTGPLVSGAGQDGVPERDLFAGRLATRMTEIAVEHLFRLAPAGVYGFSADKRVFFGPRALHDDDGSATLHGDYFRVWVLYWTLVGHDAVRPDAPWWTPKGLLGSDAKELRHYGWRLAELVPFDVARAAAAPPEGGAAPTALPDETPQEAAAEDAKPAKARKAKKRVKRRRRPPRRR